MDILSVSVLVCFLAASYGRDAQVQKRALKVLIPIAILFSMLQLRHVSSEFATMVLEKDDGGLRPDIEASLEDNHEEPKRPLQCSKNLWVVPRLRLDRILTIGLVRAANRIRPTSYAASIQVLGHWRASNGQQSGISREVWKSQGNSCRGVGLWYTFFRRMRLRLRWDQVSGVSRCLSGSICGI